MPLESASAAFRSFRAAEFFAELAQAFLFDKDGPGPKEKLAAYYHGIVKAGE